MTKAERIKQIFDPYYNAPLEVWDALASVMQERTFRKNELLKNSFQTESFLNIIISGSAGIFLDKEGHTLCLDLCYENDFFCDYMSFITQTPTPLYTQALESTTVLSATYPAMETLYATSVIGVQIGRIAAESLYIHKQNQQIELLTLTAEERYKQLLQKQPEIIKRTPSKHIASYLGVTPESLSRIRKTIHS
ncbi:MAG: Crp/Fnr family transcriptional regulator [Bacteroidia bacterium]